MSTLTVCDDEENDQLLVAASNMFERRGEIDCSSVDISKPQCNYNSLDQAIDNLLPASQRTA